MHDTFTTTRMHKNTLSFSAQLLMHLSIAALLFILPFSGVKTLHEILFFSALASFVFGKILTYKRNALVLSFASKPLDILIGISFIWALITVINAIDPQYSFNEVTHKMPKQYILYFIAFFTAREMMERGRIRWLLFPLAVSLIMMSLYACYEFYQLPVLLEHRVSGFTGAFYRLSVLLVFSIPVLIILSFSVHGLPRWILLLMLPFAFAALFFTFTRAAWIAVVVEMIILVSLFFKRFRKYLIIGAVVLSLFITLLAVRSPMEKNLIIHGTEQFRIEAFRYTVDVVSKNPFTGIGYGKRTFSKYYPDTYVQHAHNIFLNTAVETGIPGLVIFTTMMVIIVKSFVQAMRKKREPATQLLLSGIFTSLIGFLSLNLFDYMYHGWPGQMFWILVGIGIALTKHSPYDTGDVAV